MQVLLFDCLFCILLSDALLCHLTCSYCFIIFPVNPGNVDGNSGQFPHFLVFPCSSGNIGNGNMKLRLCPVDFKPRPAASLIGCCHWHQFYCFTSGKMGPSHMVVPCLFWPRPAALCIGCCPLILSATMTGSQPPSCFLHMLTQSCVVLDAWCDTMGNVAVDAAIAATAD